jgi:hypothetical protein
MNKLKEDDDMCFKAYRGVVGSLYAVIHTV